MVKTETKAFIIGGLLIILIWFLYINYTYLTPEQGGSCIEEMENCGRSVYSYFGGI